MTTTAQSASVYQGDTLLIDMTVRDNAGAPKSLVGATIKYAVGYKPGIGQPSIFQKTVGSGIAITDAANGAFTITVAAADTQALKGAAYYHECEVTDAAGVKHTVMTGTLTVLDALIV